jgi:hypothetical protein
MKQARPEWFPRSGKERLVWIAIGLIISFAPLPRDTTLAAACALYCLRVFLWPSVREQKQRESKDEADDA